MIGATWACSAGWASSPLQHHAGVAIRKIVSVRSLPGVATSSKWQRYSAGYRFKEAAHLEHVTEVCNVGLELLHLRVSRAGSLQLLLHQIDSLEGVRQIEGSARQRPLCMLLGCLQWKPEF